MVTNAQLLKVGRRQRISLAARALHSRWAYFGVAATGLILHLLFALPLYQWYDRLLAWVPLVIFLVLLWLYVHQTYKSIPLLVLVALQIYIFFSLPQFTQDDLSLSMAQLYVPSQSSVTLAMLLTVTGELAFIFAYSAAATLSRQVVTGFYRLNKAPTLNWTWVVNIYSVVSFGVYMTAALTVGYLPVSLRYLLTQLFNVYLALAILLYLGHTLNRRRLIVTAYVLAIGMSFVGLVQGMLSPIVGPFVLLFLARWVWGKVFDFRWGALALLAIILINPVKNEFRSLPSWLNPEETDSGLVQDRLRDWSASFARVWVDRDVDESVYMSTASRTSDLLSFTQAIDSVPDVIPYNEGEGMDDAVLFWIPRILRPSKGGSTDLIYNRYALLFGYLSPEEVGRTAVGISVFTEGYWNFGVYGVFIFLSFSGLLLGTLFGNNGRLEQVSTIICMVYVAPSILVLQALSVTIASLPSFLIGIFIALRALSIAPRVFRRLAS